MAFILMRPDDGKDSFLVDWDGEQSAWHSDRSLAYRFSWPGAAMDAAIAFDRRDLTRVSNGRTTIRWLRSIVTSGSGESRDRLRRRPGVARTSDGGKGAAASVEAGAVHG